jgi:hypothetical protein
MIIANRVAGWWHLRAAVSFKSRPNLGDRVRVCSGLFEGVEGTIIAHLGVCRVILAVDLDQAGVSLEVDECQIEIIG